MPTPKERLTHLLELAAKGEPARPALARTLCDILLDWPADYSDSARLPFEALLEKSLREVDRATRAEIAARFAQRADAPIDILNELFFAASAEMKDTIVARNAEDARNDADRPCSVDADRLIGIIRTRSWEFPDAFAQVLNLPRTTVDEILRDASVQALAVACKGVGLERAAFSTIAILTDRTRAAEDSYLRLAVYDTIPQGAAARLMGFWRAHPEPALAQFDQAAE
jgi:hypothetical protein